MEGSCAAHRQTTRPEDMAYCLMGLLNINMPLLHGEGGFQAFIRLQQAYISQLDDESIFAWQRPAWSGDGFGILSPEIAFFKRKDNVEAIDASWVAYE